MRSTKKVKRGLGSIRQDVNVSIKEGGVVIEVKGVQQLEQLEKVVEYEAKRQHGLLKISKNYKRKIGYMSIKMIEKTLQNYFQNVNQKLFKML